MQDSQIIPQALVKKALERGTPSLAVRTLGKGVFKREVLAASTVRGQTPPGSIKAAGFVVQQLDTTLVCEIKSEYSVSYYVCHYHSIKCYFYC